MRLVTACLVPIRSSGATWLFLSVENNERKLSSARPQAHFIRVLYSWGVGALVHGRIAKIGGDLIDCAACCACYTDQGGGSRTCPLAIAHQP